MSTKNGLSENIPISSAIPFVTWCASAQINILPYVYY